ncbi:MAG: hypothetical protein L6N96_01875 [Candidatus Methylarchaceae archaeon HK02M2]|nr:hypothetical protein [Candidatus Methylarchaceae archaeon HK02M2]
MSNVDKENAKKKLGELVSKYEQVCSSVKEGEFSEADVGSKFILPLLDILGWDINDIDEVKEQRRTLSGLVDYSLAIHGKPHLVVEIKKFTEDLDGYRDVRGRRETFPSNFKWLTIYYRNVSR